MTTQKEIDEDDKDGKKQNKIKEVRKHLCFGIIQIISEQKFSSF